MKAYGIKNGGLLIVKVFLYRKDAVDYAKYLVSNQPEINWKDVYQIVKIEIKEV